MMSHFLFNIIVALGPEKKKKISGPSLSEGKDTKNSPGGRGKMETIFLVVDGERFEISKQAIKGSGLINNILGDTEIEENQEINISNDGFKGISAGVSKKDLIKKIIEFLVKHENDPLNNISKPIQTNKIEELVGEWDAKFIDLEKDFLFSLINVANYLDIKDLLTLGILKMACSIKDKEPDEVKKMWNLEHDITEEEERIIREQNPGLFTTQ